LCGCSRSNGSSGGSGGSGSLVDLDGLWHVLRSDCVGDVHERVLLSVVVVLLDVSSEVVVEEVVSDVLVELLRVVCREREVVCEEVVVERVVVLGVLEVGVQQDAHHVVVASLSVLVRVLVHLLEDVRESVECAGLGVSVLVERGLCGALEDVAQHVALVQHSLQRTKLSARHRALSAARSHGASTLPQTTGRSAVKNMMTATVEQWIDGDSVKR